MIQKPSGQAEFFNPGAGGFFNSGINSPLPKSKVGEKRKKKANNKLTSNAPSRTVVLV